MGYCIPLLIYEHVLTSSDIFWVWIHSIVTSCNWHPRAASPLDTLSGMRTGC